MPQDSDEEIAVHERVWQELHDRATIALEGFGQKDYLGRADYWMVDDDRGWDMVKIEMQNLDMISREMIASLQSVLKDFPGWAIGVQIDVIGKEKEWPGMGIMVFADRVVDELQREFLPERFRNMTF